MQVLLLATSCIGIGIPAVHAAGAQVLYATGKAFVRETTEWTPAKAKQELNVGATVRTDAYGQVALLLSDNTQLRVNQNSEVRIKGVAADATTSIDLDKGNIWAQAKRFLRSATSAIIASRPAVEVRAQTATIGIRGTDWDIVADPDGTVTLTVLSGLADLTNEHGAIKVGPNEQARSEPGKPPTKVLLTNARERIQWVTVYKPQPRRWLESGAASLEPAVAAIEAMDYASALSQLERRTNDPTARRLMADVDIALGRAKQAIARLENATDPLSLALLAHALLIDDQAARAATVIEQGLKQSPDHPELLLAQGDWGRFEGLGIVARQSFDAAIAAAPQHPSGWFGRGRIDVEREALGPARSDLDRALELDPRGPGFLGELGTLETYANRLAAARAHFDKALAQDDGDFTAYTGLGIVELKSGRPEEALQAFLKAGVLQPGFARASVWTAVAYHQLGREQNALDTLARAAQLDPNDPLPHFYAAMIHNDRLDPGAAVAAAQRAIALWPKLKSLNQVSSDQKGSANLGATLERFGLAEWAAAAAWQSYTPFWGASHLFLADQLHDTYSKNSELFQGFLADPLVFGADPRRNALLTRPESTLGIRAKAGAGPQQLAELGGQFTGYRVAPMPFAWFVDAEANRARPDDLGLRSELANLTLGLGARPRFDTGLFLFANRYTLDIDFTDAGNALKNAPARSEPLRVDLGYHHKFSPESHFWLKAGHGDQARSIVGRTPTPTVLRGWEFYNNQPPADVGLDFDDHNRENDVQTKFSWQLGAHQLQATLEWAEGDSDYRTDTLTRTAAGTVVNFRSLVNQQRRSWRLGLGDWITLTPDKTWQLHLQASYLDYSQDDWTQAVTYLGDRAIPATPRRTRVDLSRLSPRMGAVWQFAVPSAPTFSRGTLRAAWREWLQPAGAATLERIDTAGLTLDTRAVQPGGLLRNGKLQIEWETPVSHYTAYIESERLDNRREGFLPALAATLSELEKLRQKAPDNVAAEDLLEGTPRFDAGRLNNLGMTGNWILNSHTSGYARLILRDSENRDAPGSDLPFQPRRTFALGASHFPGMGWTLGTQLVHRSQSFSNSAETLAAGWAVDGHAAWRSPDRNWRVTFLVKGLGRERPAPRSALAQVEAWW